MPANPGTSADFDRAYLSLFHWLWTDPRIPAELAALVREAKPATALEVGCGLGRFTRWVALQGVRATGVDFSPVAIAKAKARAARDAKPPEYVVGDATRLEGLAGPFDVSYDIGCFHCLGAQVAPAHVEALARVLRPGATHLLWTLDHSPVDERLAPDTIRAAFAPAFDLRDARPSRRRIVASHWYWLVRRA
jgi:SAM-dependent methyltransferase